MELPFSSGSFYLSLSLVRTDKNGHAASVVFSCFGKHSSIVDRAKANISYFSLPGFQAMRAADDAVGRLHLQSGTQDKLLALEACKAHVAAVNALRVELGKQSSDLVATLGAASILLFCESYSLTSAGPDATLTHLSGIMAALKGAIYQPLTAPLHSFLFRKFRHMSFMQSLVSRRSFVDEGSWELCSQM